jgi:hypothetical protein
MKIIVKYRCKLCGEEKVGQPLEVKQAEGYDIDIDRTIEAIIRNTQNVPHYCDNKRIGIAEPYEVIKEE